MPRRRGRVARRVPIVAKHGDTLLHFAVRNMRARALARDGIMWALCREPTLGAARNRDGLLAHDLVAAIPELRDDAKLRAQLL